MSHAMQRKKHVHVIIKMQASQLCLIIHLLYIYIFVYLTIKQLTVYVTPFVCVFFFVVFFVFVPVRHFF